MKKQRLKVEVEAWGMEVEETESYKDGTGRGWYKFEYRFRINGGKWKLGQCDGSWSGQTAAHFRRVMARGFAAQKVLGDYAY